MSLQDTGGHRNSVPSIGEWAATGIGFVAALVCVMYVVASPEPFEEWWIELAAAATMPAVLMYGGYWLATNDFDQGEVYTVAQGWFVGVVALSVVAGWAVMSARTSDPVVVESLFLLVSVASAGAVLGLAFGLHTTRLTEQFAGVTSASAVEESGEESAAPMRDAGAMQNGGETRNADAATEEADATRDAEATPRVVDPIDAADPTPVESLLDDRSITNERRRSAVVALVEHDEDPVTPSELAGALESKWNARNRETIAAELHHVHLPKLDEVGVVEYDAETTSARLSDDELATPAR